MPSAPSTAAGLPFGMKLATDRLPLAAPAYTSVALDPTSQTAVYTGADGTIIEAGKHGTNRSFATASQSGGGDGGGPQQQGQDDSVTDYDDD